MKRFKYPRTFHLPWSLGATDDDKTHTLKTIETMFGGHQVVVSEKFDGENTTLYPDSYMHARSVDSRSHESQAWVRALAATVGHNIPKGWRICGENVYAQHSIGYDRLDSYFYVFAIYDEHNQCLSWDDTVEWAALLGLITVPVLYRGEWNQDAVMACYDGTSRVGTEGEGYVVRIADGFAYSEFKQSLAKFVRADHVLAGAKHWRSCSVVANTLIEVGGSTMKSAP